MNVKALRGFYSLPDALTHLLQGTRLNAVVTEKGVIVVSMASDTQLDNRVEREQMNTKQSLLAATVAFFVGGGAAQVAAQDDSSKAEQSWLLEEIVVTATKRAKSVQDVPISMAAFNADGLEKLGAENVQDLSIPNFVFPQTFTTTRNYISVRGIFQETPNLGFDSGFGVYLDGVYLGKNLAFNVDAADLERVELLRGPQGTLFGKNTIAGAMNIVTKEPTDQLEGHIQATGGNYGLVRMRGTVNLPIVESVLSSRISFQSVERGWLCRECRCRWPRWR